MRLFESTEHVQRALEKLPQAEVTFRMCICTFEVKITATRLGIGSPEFDIRSESISYLSS